MRRMIGEDQGSGKLSSPNKGGPPCSMFILDDTTPGMTLAQPERSAYGRTSEASCLRIAIADVPNHVSPWRELSFDRCTRPGRRDCCCWRSRLRYTRRGRRYSRRACWLEGLGHTFPPIGTHG